MTRTEAERICVAAALNPVDSDVLHAALDCRPFVVDPRVQATLDCCTHLVEERGPAAVDEFVVADMLGKRFADNDHVPQPDGGWWDGWTRTFTTEHVVVRPSMLALAAATLEDASLRRRVQHALDDESEPLAERLFAIANERRDMQPDRPPVATSSWNTTDEPPARHWLSPGWIPAGRVTLFTGTGGGGKSLFALQLLAAVASAAHPDPAVDDPHRTPFGGEQLQHANAPKVNRTHGPAHALYVGWEDEPDEVLRRLHWIGADGDQLADRLHYLHLEGHGPLWGPQQGQHESVAAAVLKLGHTLEHEVQRIASLDELPLRVVVVDPAAGAFGSNENSRALVRQFMGWMARLARKHSFAAVLVAHPPKDPKPGHEYSGSTDWRAGARSMIALEVAESNTGTPLTNKDGSPKLSRTTSKPLHEPAPAWRIRRAKASYAREGDCAWLERVVETNANNHVTSLRWNETTPENAAIAFQLNKPR